MASFYKVGRTCRKMVGGEVGRREAGGGRREVMDAVGNSNSKIENPPAKSDPINYRMGRYEDNQLEIIQAVCSRVPVFYFS